MFNSIDSQTWMLIDNVNLSIQEQQKAQKEGEARVAQENSSTQGISDLQQFTKDVLLPASQYQGRGGVETAAAQADSKPQLPFPKLNWAAFQGVGEQEPGLISIIGTVLAMQSKSNSNFWSTLWQQASQSMQMEVQFAPIIGNAINASYQAQAATTLSQSQQAASEGLTSMIMFGLAVGMAGVMEFTDETNPLNKDADGIDDEDETDPANNPNAKSNDLTQQDQLDNNTNKEISNEDESFEDRAKRYWNTVKNGLSRGQQRFTSLLGKGIQTTTMMSMASDGITKYFITAPKQAEQAAFQAQQGGCQALSEEAQQYAQFYGQDFSREEDLRQGSSQNIDYAMNILKSAADSITQTVTSMFRG